MRSQTTPPEIYAQVRRCIDTGQLAAAVNLFYIAGVFWRYDAMRVADESARGAGQVLIMNTFNPLPQAVRDRFGQEMDRISRSNSDMAAIEAAARRIGAPTYYPGYMVGHGLGLGAGLVPGFDGPAAWNSLLLMLGKTAQFNQASPEQQAKLMESLASSAPRATSVVQTLRYSATLNVRGRTESVSGYYTCSSNGTDFAEVTGGPGVTVGPRRPEGLDVSISAKSADGALDLQVHPEHQMLGPSTFFMCAKGSLGAVPSIVFYRGHTDKVWHTANGRNIPGNAYPANVRDAQLSPSGDDNPVRVASSGAEVCLNMAPFFTIYLYTFDSTSIDQMGLRGYVNEAASIRLSKELDMPFDHGAYIEMLRWGDGAKYRYFDAIQKVLLKTPFRSLQPLAYSESVWHPAPNRDWVSMSEHAVTRPDVKTTVVLFKGHHIEVPIEFAHWRPIYDAEADQLIVFASDVYQIAG